MQIEIKTKTFKEKFIYVDFSENKKATKLAVFMSGFSGSLDMSLLKSASEYFFQKGFSTARVGFCNDSSEEKRKNALETKDLSLSTYTTELKNIIEHLGKKYSEIVLVGHSFGAIISILFLERYRGYLKHTKLILWDPSLLPWKKEWMEGDFTFDKERRIYSEKNSKTEINEYFYMELMQTNSSAILASLNTNACIIAAENSADKDAENYYSKISDKISSKLFIIKKTSHLFEGRKVQKELLEETINFL